MVNLRVFNEEKTEELASYDLNLGYLKSDKVVKQVHPAVLPVQEEGHYEVIMEYPNGGKDLAWVVDVHGVEARDSYIEYEDIYVYVPYTDKELAQIEISKLKELLFSTDYQAIKYAEGAMTAEEYEPIKTTRQQYRERINQLEVKFEIESTNVELKTIPIFLL